MSWTVTGHRGGAGDCETIVGLSAINCFVQVWDADCRARALLPARIGRRYDADGDMLVADCLGEDDGKGELCNVRMSVRFFLRSFQ